MVLILVSCGQIAPLGRNSKSPSYWSYRTRPIDDYSFNMPTDEISNGFKVAMLLPLSGKASSVGQGLQNAAMMALEDTKNSHLEVRFYDTKSSPEGALSALDEALKNHTQMILGPLLSEEVSAISDKAGSYGVPVISFSTSPQVLKKGVYTLGLLASEQIRSIISYAAEKGRKQIAVVVPDSSAGLNIAREAVYAAANQHIAVTTIAFYEPSTLEFSNLVQEINKAGNFDTVLIAETGSRLKAIAGTFGYYDVAYPDVLFIGTSVWENTNLTKETTLYNAVYPTISRVHMDYFNQKYKDLFGQKPNSLYAYAYDGVALASALSSKGEDNLYQYILDPDGYIGINGSFRLFEDGTNEHNLDIVEVASGEIKTVRHAPTRFETSRTQLYSTPSVYPQIIGKNQDVVYSQIFQKNESLYFDLW